MVYIVNVFIVGDSYVQCIILEYWFEVTVEYLYILYKCAILKTGQRDCHFAV